MLFEHGFKILQTSPELYAESAADPTDIWLMLLFTKTLRMAVML